MLRIDLPNLRENSAYELEGLLRGATLSNGREQLLRQLDEIQSHLHTIAAGCLLIDGDPQAFFETLCRAAENWRRLLQAVSARAWQPPPSTRNHALLGALVAGQWELAAQVAQLSATAWQEGEEYEDDACWAILLQELLHAAASPRAEALLARLEALGTDLNALRLRLARALAAKDEPSFLAAFTELHVLHADEVRTRLRMMTTQAVKFAPYRYLWFEGLAWLRLGERAGLPLGAQRFEYCPPLARVPMIRPVPKDGWLIAIGA